MSSLLIADIGGSSSRWALLRSIVADVIVEGVTGYNPATGDANAFVDALQERFHAHPEMLSAGRLIIYGAGCGSDQRRSRMNEVLREVWPNAAIEVHNDLLGSARGLCGDRKGLVLILGTGMNAGWFDGSVLHQPMPSLGYVLGDEGSGADLGKQLLLDTFYGRLPEESRAALFPSGIELAGVIDGIYRSAGPQAYLGSFAVKVADHIGDDHLHRMVVARFRALAELIHSFFPSAQRKHVFATGSVAFGLQDVLGPCLAEHGMTLTAVVRDPLSGLVHYHRRHPR